MEVEQEVPTLELGKIGYEAYRAHTGGISLASGQKIPPYEELNDQVRGAWDAAGSAIGMTIVEELKRTADQSGGKAKIKLAGDFTAFVDAEDPEPKQEADAWKGVPPLVPPPSIGRIVILHGYEEDNSPFPAIVHGVNQDGTARLTAFTASGPIYMNGSSFGFKAGQWSWPERV